MYPDSSSGFGPDIQPALGRGIFAQSLAMLDCHLRRRLGVYEYSQSPRCIFRIEKGTNSDEFRLSDGCRVAPGASIANLHFWNEQVPIMPKAGPTVAWALEMQRRIGHSLRELAAFLDHEREFSGVGCIAINLGLAKGQRNQQVAGVMERFGFERLEIEKSVPISERLHVLGENILISMIVLATNPSSLHRDTLWRDRILMAMSPNLLHNRYGISV